MYDPLCADHLRKGPGMRADKGTNIENRIAGTHKAAQHVEFLLCPFPVLTQGIEDEIILIRDRKFPVAAVQGCHVQFSL